MVAARVLKPKIENGDLMGANGGPKTEEGPHGDLGLQMGTHVGAVLRLNLATTWHHLHWLQVWPPDAAICFSCKFGHQMAPLALVSNLATRWHHLHCHIAMHCNDCLGLPYWHYQLVLGWYLNQPESHQLVSTRFSD